ncbi:MULTISPECIES: hypothetical protein [Streptomyces]|uniref:hypothetical protein n=1 Tax=Streptomyces TaxID=1883 RepID=UPI000A82ACC9
MENKQKVVIQPPDSRGLRYVSVGGATVGSAWSLRDLRRVLRHLGYPTDMDLHDRSSISWRGGDSGTWPDRTWMRRTTGALLIIGLLSSTALLALIGIPDALGALTFSQRMTGYLFILSAAAEGVAALAVLDFYGKRQFKYTGAIVLLGTLITLAICSLLLILWLQEKEFTLYLLLYAPLWLWSVWSLILLLRERVWRGLPQPKKFAAGVVATALLATINLAYSTVYQPNSVPLLFRLSARFGTPVSDPNRQVVHLPLILYAKNTGKVAAYVVNDNYYVYGSRARFSEKGQGLQDRRDAMVWGDDARLYTGTPEITTVSTGQFYGPGAWLEPGEEFSMEKVIQLPAGAGFDEIGAHLGIEVMRMDRGKVDIDEFAIPHYSWEKQEGSLYCPPDKCGEFVTHRGRLRHNNNIVNVTRRPVYFNTMRWVDAKGADFYTSMSSSPNFIPADEVAAEREEDESTREKDRYGVYYVEASTAMPYAAVRKLPAT